MTDIKVITKVGFLNEGKYAKRNSEIAVSQARAKELLLNDLIHDPAGTKAAPEHDNKSKPKPVTKAKKAAKNSAPATPTPAT